MKSFFLFNGCSFSFCIFFDNSSFSQFVSHLVFPIHPQFGFEVFNLSSNLQFTPNPNCQSPSPCPGAPDHSLTNHLGFGSHFHKNCRFAHTNKIKYPQMRGVPPENVNSQGTSVSFRFPHSSFTDSPTAQSLSLGRAMAPIPFRRHRPPLPSPPPPSPPPPRGSPPPSPPSFPPQTSPPALLPTCWTPWSRREGSSCSQHMRA